MRPVGFSTGAVAQSDFRGALETLVQSGFRDAIELSALREAELDPLLDGLPELDLREFRYVSIHAPSRLSEGLEEIVARRLLHEAEQGFPIILHPDVIRDYSLWIPFGDRLLIENMDRRKPIGRTADELAEVFQRLPDSSLCFDIGHARQVDSTMTEAYLILRDFGNRLRQLHVSEVTTASRHDRLSYTSIVAFRQVAHRIPADVPLILETPATSETLQDEIAKARSALPLSSSVAA